MTAVVRLTAGFQAAIVPSSASKMNMAADVVPGRLNPPDGFQTIPVGAELVPVMSGRCGGGGCGMVTAGRWVLATPRPSNSSTTPALLAFTQKSPPGAKATPQA